MSVWFYTTPCYRNMLDPPIQINNLSEQEQLGYGSCVYSSAVGLFSSILAASMYISIIIMKQPSTTTIPYSGD